VNAAFISALALEYGPRGARLRVLCDVCSSHRSELVLPPDASVDEHHGIVW